MPRRRRPPRAGALTELPPLKILGQIAAIQALYYGCALFLMLFTTLVAGTTFSLDLVFGWNAVRGDTTQGWLMAFVWVLDGGLFMYGTLSRHISQPCFPLTPKCPRSTDSIPHRSVAIVLLVARSKLVLDFALSLHFVHLVVVTFYSGRIPRNIMWWLSMAVASAVAVGLATWGCRYRELKPISFGGSTAAGDSGRNHDANRGDPDLEEGTAGGDDDSDQGFSRGRGRGRGRDGAGDYEMVKMNGNAEA